MKESNLIMFLLKSIEIGTLKSESAIETLCRYGINIKLSHESSHGDAIIETNNNIDNIIDSNISTNNYTSNNHNNSEMNEYICESDNVDNCNVRENFNYGDFSTRGNQIWKNNRANSAESNSDENVKLKQRYIELLQNNNVKCIPKFITEFRRAFSECVYAETCML